MSYPKKYLSKNEEIKKSHDEQEDRIESAFNEIWSRTYIMDGWMVTEMSGGYVELSSFQIRWTNSSGIAKISLPFELSTAHIQVTLQHRISRSLFHIAAVTDREVTVAVNNTNGTAYANKEQGFWIYVRGKKK